MRYKRNSDPKRLAIASFAIGNVLADPILRERLDEEGYSEERLRKGLAKIETAQQMYSSQVVGYSDRLSATGHTYHLQKSLRKQFAHDRNVVRLALEPRPGLFEKLHVKGSISRKKEVFLHQMRHFYREVIASDDVMKALVPYSLTRSVLDARLGQVEAFADAMQKQQAQLGQALLLTQRKKQAMADLDAWMVQFLFVARRAFKHEPEHLEKLVVSKSY